MSYRESGAGAPFVFLHGNPTSSYLWRKVLPSVSGVRCLAPDLIGMGESGKPDIGYTFADHVRYFEAWVDALGIDDAVLVGHDWGGALAFDWAARHPERVRGIAFLETILRPMAWSEFPANARPVFEAFRTPGIGERLVLEENAFIEQSLSRTIPELTDADLAVYRAPYPTPESRRPLLQWPRSMPLDGTPTDVVMRVAAYDGWLAASSHVPKLLLTFDPGPGIMIGPDAVAWSREHIAALEVTHCGAAGHHAPEQRPDAIAAAVVEWADRWDLRTRGDQTGNRHRPVLDE
jgi:haloalkane dehalogenase